MNLNPKTEHLTKWHKGQSSPNPLGRKPKFTSILKNKGYTHSEITDSILIMLAMSKNELENVILNENLTILEETIASVLLESAKKKNLNAIEYILKRSFGLNLDSKKSSIQNKKIEVTLNLSK